MVVVLCVDRLVGAFFVLSRVPYISCRAPQLNKHGARSEEERIAMETADPELAAALKLLTEKAEL